jgi:hypothetical protein
VAIHSNACTELAKTDVYRRRAPLPTRTEPLEMSAPQSTVGDALQELRVGGGGMRPLRPQAVPKLLRPS